jgi:GNAT superfamily N-acetyltransferase
MSARGDGFVETLSGGAVAESITPSNLDELREAILALKLDGNFASDPVWAQEQGFEEYRNRWLASTQPDEFLAALKDSLRDPRTIADVFVDQGEPIAFVWVTFVDVPAFDLCIGELRDIAVLASRRREGIGSEILRQVADGARAVGAHVLRGETGAGNMPMQRAAEAFGAAACRVTYELVLDPSRVRG